MRRAGGGQVRGQPDHRADLDDPATGVAACQGGREVTGEAVDRCAVAAGAGTRAGQHLGCQGIRAIYRDHVAGRAIGLHRCILFQLVLACALPLLLAPAEARLLRADRLDHLLEQRPRDEEEDDLAEHGDSWVLRAETLGQRGPLGR